MRVAGHTYAYRGRPLEEALDELAALGLELVEVWLGHAADGPDEVARALAERNLQAVALSAGGFYDDRTTAPARAFELAAAVGAPVVVACVLPALLPAIAERTPPGIELCVENHWDQPLATPRAVETALAGLPDIRACLDTGHAILAGVRPEDFVATLGDRLGHIHLKEAAALTALDRLLGRRARRRLGRRPEPVFPGRGALEPERLRRALDRIGYCGAVTVEYEGPEPSAALAALIRTLERPGG